MNTKAQRKDSSIENIYRLDGRVPIGKAIPFGLQHVLAMFVANVAPLIIIASVAVYNGIPFTAAETAQLLQNCMLIAGIGTLVQLYPVWKVGSGLPVVMGLSFTFLATAMTTASQDYGIMVGAIIVGGCFEGILGLTAKYWRRIISPTLSACVVISIGLSILNVGVSSFGSSSAYPLGSWQNLLETLTPASVAPGQDRDVLACRFRHFEQCPDCKFRMRGLSGTPYGNITDTDGGHISPCGFFQALVVQKVPEFQGQVIWCE